MRLVNVNDIEEGMILGKPIYSGENLLLQEGVKLKKRYKQKIQDLGYNNIYIQDELLQDLEINEIVNDELRREAVSNIKGTFADVENKSTISSKDISTAKQTVDKLIEEIIDNRNLMVNMVDLKMYNDYVFQHSVNVAILAVIVGISMGLNQQKIYRLGLGALMHDIGKTAISNKLLDKPDKLTDEEYEEMKTHPNKGYEILKENEDLPSTSTIVTLQHHERVNGEGYPEGRAGDNIHLLSRIVAVADVYDALVSNRPYREALLPSEAMEYLLGGAGYLFDRQVVGHFFRKVATFPLGTEIKLSDDRRGLVIENFEKYSLRPRVRIIEEKQEEIEPYDIDLRKAAYNSITIIETR